MAIVLIVLRSWGFGLLRTQNIQSPPELQNASEESYRIDDATRMQGHGLGFRATVVKSFGILDPRK